MKKFCIILNSIIIVLIIATITFNPKVNKSNVDVMSKSLTTSTLLSSKTEEVPHEEETPEVKEETQEENIGEVVEEFEDNVSENVAPANVVSDVLETQVGTMSAYGLDCAGCSGRVGAGYDAAGNNVRYYDPSYGECRIIAADPKYPYGTIIRVVDSKIGTFNAIVLDRGGNIGIGRRFMADLLFHTEAEASGFGLSRNTTFEVLRYGY